jgi:hypothetical protein
MVNSISRGNARGVCQVLMLLDHDQATPLLARAPNYTFDNLRFCDMHGPSYSIRVKFYLRFEEVQS